ncbi:homoprotocatechuate degradation operon regulator HpaR [Salinisphaera sp. USBA-960]|nr:homoprotocatechuate degradation operon regulator HpaR [Salifodinibacter halophilus]NNC25808.1 homoprotocatechuate degradation operon regulator HpaR [Salifodinibacter halophilus]
MSEINTQEQEQLDDYARHPLETRRALPMTLLRAREAIMARFRPMLTAHGVSEQQWRVMRILAEEDTLDASEVSKRACIFESSLSRIIKTLEKQEFVARDQDLLDARRIRLRLTEDGHRLIGKLTPESLEIYTNLEKEFGKERVAILISMLNELTELN